MYTIKISEYQRKLLIQIIKIGVEDEGDVLYEQKGEDLENAWEEGHAIIDMLIKLNKSPTRRKGPVKVGG